MGKSFRKERSDWDDADWGCGSRIQRDARKMAKAERDTRKTRRNFDDRQKNDDDA